MKFRIPLLSTSRHFLSWKYIPFPFPSLCLPFLFPWSSFSFSLLAVRNWGWWMNCYRPDNSKLLTYSVISLRLFIFEIKTNKTVLLLVVKTNSTNTTGKCLEEIYVHSGTDYRSSRSELTCILLKFYKPMATISTRGSQFWTFSPCYPPSLWNDNSKGLKTGV